MLETVVSALEYLGTRVQWEALSAIGTVLAVFWAIGLANRQAADTRRREAALLKACIVPMAAVHERLQETWEAFEENCGNPHGNLSQSSLSEGKATFVKARAAGERALNFLDGLDVMRLPTSASIVVILDMRMVIKEAIDEMSALVDRAEIVHEEEYPRSLVVLEELIFKLGDEANALGARATAEDRVIFHLALDPAPDARDHVRQLIDRAKRWRRKAFGPTKAERALDAEIPF